MTDQTEKTSEHKIGKFCQDDFPEFNIKDNYSNYRSWQYNGRKWVEVPTPITK